MVGPRQVVLGSHTDLLKGRMTVAMPGTGSGVHLCHVCSSPVPSCTQPEPSECPLHAAHLCSQVVARGQVFEAVKAVPVAGASAAGVMVDHLGVGVRNKDRQTGEGGAGPVGSRS